MNLRHIFILPALLTAMACSDDSPVTPDTPDTPEGPDITNSVEKLVSIDAGQERIYLSEKNLPYILQRITPKSKENIQKSVVIFLTSCKNRSQ